MSDDNFLTRWSRRKHDAKRPAEAPAEKPAAAVAPVATGAQSPLGVQEKQPEPPPLPPVESLTPESDFTPFMRSEVDPGTRRAALRTLFSDPRFNVMDGLDVYIDDYSQPDPLPEGWLEKMNQLARMGDFHLKESENAEAVAEGPENAQLAEKEPLEQPLAPEADANSSDTRNEGETPAA